MIPCQRELFDIPVDIGYFNCAYTSPMMRSAQTAGNTAIGAKANPWTIAPGDFFTQLEENRTLFGSIIGASPDHVTIVPAASYGIALAAANLPVSRSSNIVVLEDQFPSNIYVWRKMARENSAAIKTVPRPGDGDWTTAVFEAMDADTAIAALPHCHWTDGTRLDLEKIGAHCRRIGAALVVDGTQSVGAMPFLVDQIQPDLLVAAAHKWLLGPYSYGFCYVAPKWHGGVPLEENWLNRKSSEDFSRLVDYREGYQPGARRYDVGGSSNFILAPMAAALRQILDWRVSSVAETLSVVTGKIARAAARAGFDVPREGQRALHMIGIKMPDGIPDALLSVLAAEKLYVSIRGNSIRISPHLYNTNEEVDRLIHAFGKL